MEQINMKDNKVDKIAWNAFMHCWNVYICVCACDSTILMDLWRAVGMDIGE
jgi:hypothetical protein